MRLAVVLLLGVAGCGRVGFDALSDGHTSDDGKHSDGAIPLGMVAWWKLDDGSGNVAVDSSGNGNNATLTGDPVWGTGLSGGDLTFNGVNQQAAAIQMVPVGEVLSLSFWVATTSTSEGDAVSLGLYAGCALSFSPGILDCTPDGMLQLQGPLASDGTWHFVVYVSAGADSAQSLYVDGVLQVSMNGTVNETRGTAVCLGSECGQFFEGAALEDVRIYDRALPAAEIASNYRDGPS